MHRTVFIGIWVLLLFAVSTNKGFGQPKGSAPAIDPRVDKLVRQWSDRHTKLTHYSFQVIDTIDEVQESGQKLQFSHVRTVTVSRPSKLRVETLGDLSSRSIWKDEKTLTILDRDSNVYGQIEFSGTIEEMMDSMLDRYGVSTPLADLLSSDIYATLMGNAQTGRYLGLHHVGETKCHHLAVTQENIDWQIWIDAGETPRFRKIVITHKQLPGEPQYTATVQQFSTLPQAPVEKFTFAPPPEAERIGFLPIKKNAAGDASTAQ